MTGGIGKARNARGEYNEQRVFDSVAKLGLEWVKGARRATPEEDAKGVDIIVDTDVGPLFLQVKSSRMYSREFERKKRSKLIAVVAVGACNPRTLRRRVRSALFMLRARVKEAREFGYRTDFEAVAADNV